MECHSDMKIRSVGGAGYPMQVRERSEKQQQSGDQSKDQQNSQKHQSSQEVSETEFQEKLDEAVQAFAEDSQTLANGLKASVNGSGPGLKVVLTDQSGSVVRQLTCEEFMKLREMAPSGSVKIRGKILDQKL
jgi:uncharacterized FlaG/YvyC family protein